MALGILAIAACGGGGGSSAGKTTAGAGPGEGGGGDVAAAATPPAPALELAVETVKTFRFTWADVRGEAEYRLLEDRDGVSGYQTVTILPAQAVAHVHRVFLPARIGARYILRACNDGGCSDSDPVRPLDVLASGAGYFKGVFNDEDDRLASAIAVSADGEVIAVGVPGEDRAGARGTPGTDNSLLSSGMVLVYTRDAGTESWRADSIKAGDEADRADSFGFALDLSGDGNVIVVGATGEDGDGSGEANNAAGNSGAAYVFARAAPGLAFARDGYLKAGNPDDGDLFGWAVAISGDGTTVAVGARNADGSATGIDGAHDNSATDSGAAYVFVVDESRPGKPWVRQAYVKATNTQSGDLFGAALDLSETGDLLAVGAHREDGGGTGPGAAPADNTAADSGAAYVYSRTGSAWSPGTYLKPLDTESGASFGFAVAVAADGASVAAGAPAHSGGGRAYVFNPAAAGGGWAQDPAIAGMDTAAGDVFGDSVSLRGDGALLAVGAPSHDATGAVYTFASQGASMAWLQQAKVIAPNADPDDRFGDAVGLGRDGDTLAIGAPEEDGSAILVGGDGTSDTLSNSGAMYLY